MRCVHCCLLWRCQANCLGGKGGEAAAFVTNATKIAQGKQWPTLKALPTRRANGVASCPRVSNRKDGFFVREAAFSRTGMAGGGGHQRLRGQSDRARRKGLILNVEGKFAPAFGHVSKLRLPSRSCSGWGSPALTQPPKSVVW